MHLTADTRRVGIVHHAEGVTALGEGEEDGPDVWPGVNEEETQALLRGIAVGRKQGERQGCGTKGQGGESSR